MHQGSIYFSLLPINLLPLKGLIKIEIEPHRILAEAEVDAYIH